MVVDVIPKTSNSNCEIQIRNILVPIDGSECSLNAARYAVKLAKDFGDPEPRDPITITSNLSDFAKFAIAFNSTLHLLFIIIIYFEQ